MTDKSTFTKDPAAVLDYKFDWKAATNGTSGADGDWLAAAETISTTTITVSPTGTGALSAGAPTLTNSSTSVTVWLSGGVDGVDYDVTCQIVTNQLRTDERTIHVKARNR